MIIIGKCIGLDWAFAATLFSSPTQCAMQIGGGDGNSREFSTDRSHFAPHPGIEVWVCLRRISPPRRLSGCCWIVEHKFFPIVENCMNYDGILEESRRRPWEWRVRVRNIEFIYIMNFRRSLLLLLLLPTPHNSDRAWRKLFPPLLN